MPESIETFKAAKSNKTTAAAPAATALFANTLPHPPIILMFKIDYEISDTLGDKFQ